MADEEEKRSDEIQKLLEFENKVEAQLDAVLTQMNWTRDDLMRDDKLLVECPLDKNHKMPAAALEKHLQTCPLLQAGYTKKEVEMLPPSSRFFYKNSSTVVSLNIDEPTQAAILTRVADPYAGGGSDSRRGVPVTPERAMTELSQTERLAIYDYCISTAKTAQKPVTISTDELMLLTNEERKTHEDRPKSHLEKLAEMRDYKRRRQSYRAKNVHITKKSHTEIIREVINNQMEVLTQMCKDEEEVRKTDKDQHRSRKRSRSAEREWEDRSSSHHRSDESNGERRHKKHGRHRSRDRDEDMDRGSDRDRSKHKKHKKHKHHRDSR